MGHVGIFLPGETAAESQNLYGGTDGLVDAHAHPCRRCPFDDKFFSGFISQGHLPSTDSTFTAILKNFIPATP
jgi:hypothetical protein